MASIGMQHRKPPRTPAGCDDHLTRQQAAQLLGFPSEFKIRQLEREGRLHSVRGPMRTAFYARADLLALKAELVRQTPEEAGGGWTDAELLLLLAQPNREGRMRTALDLVLETRISIDHAERVCSFWSACQTAASSQAVAEPAPSARTAGATGQATAGESKTTNHATDRGTTASAPPTPVESTAERAAVADLAPNTRLGSPATVEPPTPSGSLDFETGERRGEERLSRDLLIQELRDPDPRVRERAFARLKQAMQP